MKDYFSKGVTKVQKIVLDYVDYYRSVKLHKKLTFDRQKVVIFVGAPRSGTTLVGYLLGLHPNALISIESRLIQNVVLNNHDYSSELLSSERYAILQHVLGVNNMRNRKVTSKFQAQWKSVDDSTLFDKKQIRVVGDKKAGGSTHAYKVNKSKFLSVIERDARTHLIHVIRNPIHAAKSYVKSHPHEVNSFNEALSKIVEYHAFADEIIQNTGSPSTVVMYESLQNNPNDVISKIFSDLQLESTENLINEISRVVQRSHKKTSHSDDDAFREVLMKYNDVSNLEPYLVKE